MDLLMPCYINLFNFFLPANITLSKSLSSLSDGNFDGAPLFFDSIFFVPHFSDVTYAQITIYLDHNLGEFKTIFRDKKTGE